MHDKVVCIIEEQEPMSAGGILLPESAQGKSNIGLVESVGSGDFNAAGVFVWTTTRPGDRVLFGQWSGQEVQFDNQKRFILRESDILGKIVD